MNDDRTSGTRMLLVDPEAQRVTHAKISDLARVVRPGDVFVVNDAATLPASLRGKTARGAFVEVRLLEPPETETTWAVLLGEGDSSMRTEDRAPPPLLAVDDEIQVGTSHLRVHEVSAVSPRLVQLGWPLDRAGRYETLYRDGVPIQYSYQKTPYALWDVQTSFASRPWAIEMPSAGRPLRRQVHRALLERGAEVLALTHAAGLSSSGDAAIDALLPLPERYEISAFTARRVGDALRARRRIIAVGTSVVRALEDSVLKHGFVKPGEATATLVIDETTRLNVCSGILTGIHMPGESHFRLLSAFASGPLLTRGADLAHAAAYRAHEQGDACLILSDALARETTVDVKPLPGYAAGR